jgi:hypothetical protein
VTQVNDWASLSSIAKSSPGVGAYFVLVGTSERLPTWIMRDVSSGTIHKSSVESVWRVDQVFPYKVYINSNRRNSQR